MDYSIQVTTTTFLVFMGDSSWNQSHPANLIGLQLRQEKTSEPGMWPHRNCSNDRKTDLSSTQGKIHFASTLQLLRRALKPLLVPIYLEFQWGR